VFPYITQKELEFFGRFCLISSPRGEYNIIKRKKSNGKSPTRARALSPTISTQSLTFSNRNKSPSNENHIYTSGGSFSYNSSTSLSQPFDISQNQHISRFTVMKQNNRCTTSSSDSLPPAHHAKKIKIITDEKTHGNKNTPNLVLVCVQFESPIYVLLVFQTNITLKFHIYFKEIDMKLTVDDMLKSKTYNIFGNVQNLKLFNCLNITNSNVFENIFYIFISSMSFEL
jgi:hypothetical protein